MERNSLIVDAIVKKLTVPRLKVVWHHNTGSMMPNIPPHFIIELQLRPLHQSKGRYQIGVFEDHVIVWKGFSYSRVTERFSLSDPNLITELQYRVQSFFFPKWLDNPRLRGKGKLSKTRDKVLYKDLKCR